MTRLHNFSAGPAALPLPVLEELGSVLCEFGGMGAGIMEISHRSKAFTDVSDSAEAKLRSLMNIPKDYAVLMLQGGASLQFYMSALNLLDPNDGADFVVTGAWSEKALKEAKRVSRSAAVWTPNDGIFNRVPADGSYIVSSDATYVHYTTNNTIFGTQFQSTPNVGDKPLVGDMSSDICSRPVDVSKHAVIYAGAQKNLGPSGVTVVILSPWALEKSRARTKSMAGGLPAMLDYGLMADKKSLFNTPNTIGIYTLERVLSWIETQGGLESMAALNDAKAAKLYTTLDKTDFWKPHAQDGSRSRMNVAWRGPSDELENTFLAEAEQAGLRALKGHRSVGGIRASIYNACPEASIDVLVDFMDNFEKKHG